MTCAFFLDFLGTKTIYRMNNQCGLAKDEAGTLRGTFSCQYVCSSFFQDSKSAVASSRFQLAISDSIYTFSCLCSQANASERSTFLQQMVQTCRFRTRGI